MHFRVEVQCSGGKGFTRLLHSTFMSGLQGSSCTANCHINILYTWPLRLNGELIHLHLYLRMLCWLQKNVHVAQDVKFTT